MGMDYMILQCDVLDVFQDVDNLLSRDHSVFVLTEVDRMRPDLREELEARIAKTVDKTFWILETEDP
jgi:hypothetical protein